MQTQTASPTSSSVWSYSPLSLEPPTPVTAPPSYRTPSPTPPPVQVLDGPVMGNGLVQILPSANLVHLLTIELVNEVAVCQLVPIRGRSPASGRHAPNAASVKNICATVVGKSSPTLAT
jgi:hypothetical protein